MKKLRILLFLLVVSNSAYGQDQKETVGQFFELVNCKGILSRGFLGIESYVAVKKESFKDLNYWVLRIEDNDLRLQTTTETLLEMAEPISHAEHRQLLVDSLRAKASASLPTAIALSQQADEFTAFCDQLRGEIINRTGGYGPDDKPVGLANKAEVNKLFLDEKQA